MADITTLTSPDGAVTTNTAGTVATVTLPATGTDASGAAISGTLTLAADEVRGSTYKFRNTNSHYYASWVITSNSPYPAIAGGSCWVGTPGVTVADWTKTQTNEALPVFAYSGASSDSGAAAAFNSAIAAADGAGTVQYSTVYASPTIASATNGTTIPLRCDTPTPWASAATIGASSASTYDYSAAAHVLALKPTTLTFSTPASGAWNATLTVTAYQM